MHRRPLHLHLLLFLCLVSSLAAQPIDVQRVRTYDGSFNNPDHPQWGAAGTNLLRVVPPAYSDGMAQPAAPDRANPRDISNTLFAQEGLLNDPLSLSDFCWVWGQFIDHDIGITPDGHEPAFISVPAGDPHFDPAGTGQVFIPMMRNRYDPNTGTAVDNPRQHPNMITSFIDGSAIYGSSEATASWLRTFQGGKLKVSVGNLMPFNTTTGELDAPVDDTAPHMDDAVGHSDKHFVAGDVRANENPLLASFHTLFVREHNRLCDQLANEHPDWSDEELYQYARKLVGGLIQSIVYDEWLPTMGIKLDAYTGYDASVHPQLSNVFTGAAFRLGHTLLNGNLQRLDNNGEELPIGALRLRQAFFNPMTILESGGIDPFFKGMAVQIQQGMDPQVIDDVRNFLFGPPGAGGLDLAAININRGRERGLADLNSVRAAFGLPKYRYFQQLNAGSAVFTRLFGLYKDINNIDPWVGMLAESPMPGALFGETLLTILRQQFTALRDGDRFYYENDPVLSAKDKAWIRRTRLRDVIMYNTSITLMQDNVFKAMPHTAICDNMTGSIVGEVRTEHGHPIPEVEVQLTLDIDTRTAFSSFEGAYTLEELPACQINSLIVSKTDAVRKGISTMDILLMQKHILGLELLDSPYKMIAADVDRNGRVSVQDIIQLRRVILGLTDSFPNNTAWRFVPTEVTFTHPAQALREEIPEVINFNAALGGSIALDYIGVKIGDINGSATLDGLNESPVLVDRQSPDVVTLELTDMLLLAGQVYQVPLRFDRTQQVVGLQFGLQIDPVTGKMLTVEAAGPEISASQHLGQLFQAGQLTFSWHTSSQAALEEEQALFIVTVRAERDMYLSEFLKLDDRITPPEAYTEELRILPVVLQYSPEQASERVYLGQNYPNPFFDQTSIPFTVVQPGDVQLRIVDLQGRVLEQREAHFDIGQHEWLVQRQDWPAGVLWYQIRSGDQQLTRRMILITE